MTRLDLTGQRFGHLVALRADGTDKHGNVVWECRCDCGNLCNATAAKLRKGAKKSCGCMQGGNHGANKKDLTGMRFGRLLVIREHGRMGKAVAWLCRCDCGREIAVRSSDLLSQGQKSCGCASACDQVGGTKTSIFTSEKPRANNTSGSRGVSWDGRRQKWQASIMFRRKNVHLGRFHDKSAAIRARERAEDAMMNRILPNVESISDERAKEILRGEG